MKSSIAFVSVVTALGLSACDKPTTVVVPPTPVVETVPGPAGPQGDTGKSGATGATGTQGDAGKPGGDTIVVVPPAPEKK
jgi:hypothetical protein